MNKKKKVATYYRNAMQFGYWPHKDKAQIPRHAKIFFAEEQSQH